MTKRQRGSIPSADRARRPADIAFLDTMQIVVDRPFVIPTQVATTASHGARPLAAAHPVDARAGVPVDPARPQRTGALLAHHPAWLTSDVVSLEVTT